MQALGGTIDGNGPVAPQVAELNLTIKRDPDPLAIAALYEKDAHVPRELRLLTHPQVDGHHALGDVG